MTDLAADLREPHAAPWRGIEGAAEQCGNRVGNRLPCHQGHRVSLVPSTAPVRVAVEGCDG
jgi:hypothetical protein